MNKLLVTIMLCSSALIVACSSGSVHSTGNPQNPIVTLLTESQLSKSFQNCYMDLESFSSMVAGINNNGVVAGAMLDDPNTGCLQHGYLWDNSKGNSFLSIPFIKPPKFTVAGTRLTSISSNLITGGVTITKPALDTAIFNVGTAPKIAIANWNYVFGISEQGQFILGTTIFGSYLFFDTKLNKQIKLTYNGTPLSNFTVALVTASNNGKAVGTLVGQSEKNYNSGIICQAVDGTCAVVAGGDKNGYDAHITSISANGNFIYGYSLDNKNMLNVFSINPLNNHITPLIKSFFIHGNSITNDGLVTITHINDNKVYIYDPAVNGLYSVKDLANKLNLPANTKLSEVHLSPNGNYLAFDVSSYDNDILALKVFFPQGIAKYIENNIRPYHEFK